MGRFCVGKTCKAALLTLAVIVFLTGCGGNVSQDAALVGTNIEYTVVEDADVPEKLAELIEQKKSGEFRLTFTTNDYMYMAVGYGTKETDGYSIKVRGVTVDDSTVYVGTSLYGPAENEKVAKVETTPYIVLKAEKRGSVVVYR
jgi:hypothetical protein